MKKIVSILLCLALLLSCAAALAEKTAEKTELKVNDSLTLMAAIPEGYEILNLSDEEGILYMFQSKDETQPILALGLGVDDSWPQGTKLNNLGEEDLKTIENTKFLEYDPDMEISYTETEHGTKLLVATEKDKSIVVFYTLYEGYEIEFDLAKLDGTALSQEQIDSCVKFLSDLDLIISETEKAEKEAEAQAEANAMEFFKAMMSMVPGLENVDWDAFAKAYEEKKASGAEITLEDCLPAEVWNLYGSAQFLDENGKIPEDLPFTIETKVTGNDMVSTYTMKEQADEATAKAMAEEIAKTFESDETKATMKQSFEQMGEGGIDVTKTTLRLTYVNKDGSVIYDKAYTWDELKDAALAPAA